MALTIIRATPGDVESVAPLFDSYRQFYGQSSDPAGARAFLRARLEQAQAVIFLASREAMGCGFAQLYPSFSSVAMRPIWILNDLFVAPEARGAGVGKRLMRRAMEFASEDGAKRLVLATGVENRTAQSLYEGMGWVRDDAFLHYTWEI